FTRDHHLPRRTVMQHKILIADDNESMRWALRNLIMKSRPDWEVCGEAANGEQAVSAAAELKPNVVILDESMPVMTGLEAAARIADLGLKVRIFVLTAFEPNDLAVRAEAAGAPPYTFVDKSNASRDLILAIESAVAKSRSVPPRDTTQN